MFEYTFDDALLTGDAAIDEQHRQLFATVRRLDEAIVTGRGPEIVETILEELLGYAAIHFHDEERLMESVGFPGLESQRAAHRAFSDDATQMAKAWVDGRDVASEDLSAYLYQWLARHVETADLLLARYLAAQGRAAE